MGYNLENRSCHTQYISEKKWESRLIGERYVPSSDSNQEFARLLSPTSASISPKKWLNTSTYNLHFIQNAKNQVSQKDVLRDHLDIFHQIKINSIDEISDHLKKNSKKKIINEWDKKVSKCKNRQEMIQVFNEIFEPNYNKIKRFFGLIKSQLLKPKN